MNDHRITNQNSAGWMAFVKICFGTSIAAMAAAILFLPGLIWVKGYLAMGTLLIIASSFMLAKSVRDDFEAHKLSSQISEAKAERMIKELDVAT